MILVAKCIINAALSRKDSIGAHYRADSTPVSTVNEHAGFAEKSEDKADDSKIIA